MIVFTVYILEPHLLYRGNLARVQHVSVTQECLLHLEIGLVLTLKTFLENVAGRLKLIDLLLSQSQELKFFDDRLVETFFDVSTLLLHV